MGAIVSNAPNTTTNARLRFAGALLAAASAIAPGHAEEKATPMDPVIVRPTPSPSYIPIYVPITFTFDFRSPSSEGVFNPGSVSAVRADRDDCSGNPVELFSGNKIEPETDFVGGGEMPLTMNRIYSNGAAAFNHPKAIRGMLGVKWRTSFDYSVERQTTYRVWAWRPDGRRIEFAPVGGGWPKRYEELRNGKLNPRMYIEVSEVPYGEQLVLHTEDGETETYYAQWLDQWYGAGHILERKNAQGVSWTFEYSAAGPSGRLRKVQHSSGRSVQFQLAPERLTVLDPAGNPYQYAFSGGRLVSVTQPGPPSTTISYHYESTQYPNALTGKSFGGVRYSTFAYDANGRATDTQHAGRVEHYNFGYSGSPDGTWFVTETNPLGNRTIHTYDKGKKVSVAGEASPNCASRQRALTYDANGYADIVTDFAGGRTNFDHDEHGHLLRKVEAADQPGQRITSYVWDEAKSRIVAVTIDGLTRTEHAYDDLGRVISDTVTDLTSSQTRTTQYGYATHSNGMLATYTVDGPGSGPGDRVTYSYSPVGDLLGIANALGHTTTYANHNALGLPGRVTSPSGAVTEYEYDARGRVVVERTYPSGSPVETRYVYGASGLLEEKRTSDGNVVLYHYDDARRLIQEDMTEPGGGFSVRRYTYNAMSQPVRVETGRDN